MSGKSVTDEAAFAKSLNEFSACVFTKEAEGHIPEIGIHFLEGKSEMLKGFYDHINENGGPKVNINTKD